LLYLNSDADAANSNALHVVRKVNITFLAANKMEAFKDISVVLSILDINNQRVFCKIAVMECSLIAVFTVLILQTMLKKIVVTNVYVGMHIVIQSLTKTIQLAIQPMKR
jgi:predicted acyltransferase